ncbi:Predicted protein [Streptococcus thermophilus LMD-9]|jgi:hypothetical protein|nr:Predicted protein [Streptococcus thermophilus LMD-9]
MPVVSTYLNILKFIGLKPGLTKKGREKGREKGRV